jgi:hypothetical protein
MQRPAHVLRLGLAISAVLAAAQYLPVQSVQSLRCDGQQTHVSEVRADVPGGQQLIRLPGVLSAVQQRQMPIQQLVHRRIRAQASAALYPTQQPAARLLSLRPRRRTRPHRLGQIRRPTRHRIRTRVDRTHSDPVGNRLIEPRARRGIDTLLETATT